MNVTEAQKQEAIRMANVIFNTLFWSIDMDIFGSWGVSHKNATHFNQMPALEMDVNGLKHKGKVMVCYDEGHDVFEVYLIDSNYQIVKTMKDVYADELGRQIDEAIEKPAGMTDIQYKGQMIQAVVNA